MSETLKKQLQTLSGSYMEQLIRANRAEAEGKKLRERVDQLDEAIRSALDVTVGWDQIWKQGTANVTDKDKLERLAKILNVALHE